MSESGFWIVATIVWLGVLWAYFNYTTEDQRGVVLLVMWGLMLLPVIYNIGVLLFT